MGEFLTSTQIFDNEMLGSKQFIDKFCKKMAEEGYETCESGECEISYIFKFADNRKWVTITSEAYEQGNEKSKNDTGRIAKMLKTTCINTTVIDSDCAIMDLYDKNGKKADTLIMGRTDDYFGNHIPQPSEKIWKPFLCNGSTWEQFSEVLNGDYIFIEEGLSKLAPVIGMDGSNITFEVDDADENDKDVVLIYFKKAKACITISQGGKADKKMLSIVAAFKQIFGEVLKPIGFREVKNRYPYYVRMIGNDIAEIIALIDETPLTAFSVSVGVATVYRRKITLYESPKFNGNWMSSIRKFYCDKDTFDFDNDYAGKLYHFEYNGNSETSMIRAMENAFAAFSEIVLPELDNVLDMKSAIDHMVRFGCAFKILDNDHIDKSVETSENYLFYTLEEPFYIIEVQKEYVLKRLYKMSEKQLNGYSIENWPDTLHKFNLSYENARHQLSSIIKDETQYKLLKQKAESNKKFNSEILRKCGVLF